MKINKERIDKIIDQFKMAAPNMEVMALYVKDDVNIVMAMPDPNNPKMGLPFYRVAKDGTVFNVPVTSNPQWFADIVKSENIVYFNQDIEYETKFVGKDDEED